MATRRRFSVLTLTGSWLLVALAGHGTAREATLGYDIDGVLDPAGETLHARGALAPLTRPDADAVLSWPESTDLEGSLLLTGARATLMVYRAEEALGPIGGRPVSPAGEAAYGQALTLENVRITAADLEQRPQAMARAVKSSDPGAAGGSCEIRDADDNRVHAFPADPAMVSDTPTKTVAEGSGRLAAECTLASRAPVGYAASIALYGFLLFIEADGVEPWYERTGTYQATITTGLPAGKVTQYVQVHSLDETLLQWHVDAQAQATLLAPAFAAVGRLESPESRGELTWAGHHLFDPVPSIVAEGTFELAWAEGDRLAIAGTTTNPPNLLPASAALTRLVEFPAVTVLAVASLAGAFLLLGLFARLRRDRVLRNRRRALLFEFVAQNPGAEVGEAARLLGVAWPNAMYHARRLVSSGHMVVRRVGGRTALFPASGGPSESVRPAVSLLRRSAARRVFEALRAEPGLDQDALARRLGIRQQSVSRTLAALLRSGAVAVETSRPRSTYRAVGLAAADRARPPLPRAAESGPGNA